MCNSDLHCFSDVCQTTVNTEADAVRPGTASHAPVMGRGTPVPPVTHVRMCLDVSFYIAGCLF